MLSWLALWGATKAVGFVFKPVLEELATDAAKDWVKDIFKDSLKNVLHLPTKEPLDIAAGKAIKVFLQLVQDQLEDGGLDDKAIEGYISSVKKFIHDTRVKAVLGSPFQKEAHVLDITTLVQRWQDLPLKTLPENFNWDGLARRYLRAVKGIYLGSEELQKLLDSLALQTTATGIQELAGIPADFDLAKYRETVQENYGNLKLESLDTTGGYYELKLWQIFIPQSVRECDEYLPQIHELPKEVLRRLEKEGNLEVDLSSEDLKQYKTFYTKQPICSVLEIATQPEYNYLVILGDPGSGKSTLLQYLLLDWAETPLKELPLSPLPLLIELRAYIRNRDRGLCKNLLEFLHNKASGFICPLNQHHLHKWLKDGKAIVMFDGLDEVFDPGNREDLIKEIIHFTNDYKNTRVIVTSRVIGYKIQPLRDAGFAHFMLQELDDTQIENFIQRWHDLAYIHEAEKKSKQDRLKQAIDDSLAIRELAGNPLLLTMMAILNRHQELPRDRAELYKQASRVLLQQWDVERALVADPRIDHKTIDYKDKQAMLRKVAYHMQSQEQGLSGNVVIHSTNLEKILTKSLVTLVGDQYARIAARLIIDQLRTRNFILCYLGAAEYYSFVHRTFLEYFCAWEFVWQFEKERKFSSDHLKTEIFGAHWPDEAWHEVLCLIAGMLEPKFVQEIIEFLLAQNGQQVRHAHFLAARCFSEVRTRSQISATVVRRLLELLQSYAQPHEDWPIRSSVMKIIGRGWAGDPEILVWLKNLVRQDTNSAVRQKAVEQVVKYWKQDSETLPWFKTLVRSDESMYVRQTAAQEIAKGWGISSEIFEFFCNLVMNYSLDEQKDWIGTPRQTALETIVEYYPENSQTSGLLRNCARHDPNEKIRDIAKKALLTRSE